MRRAAGSARPLVLLPDPERFWIRCAPRSWESGPPADRPWLDLARGRLGAVPAGAPAPPALATGEPGDVLYVPPVAAERGAARDRRVEAAVAAGTPVLVQLLPGEAVPAGAVGVYDLLATLLESLRGGDLGALADLPPGSAAAWPLLAGLTDAPEMQEEGCRLLQAAGVAVVQALAPDLPPTDRRRLVELAGTLGAEPSDAVFESLFHGRSPDPRPFARRAHRHGLAPFLPRPLPRSPLAAAREIGGLLALAAELVTRLGRVGRGQALFRAARWADRGDVDLRGLARDGNLRVLPWLAPDGRRIVEEWSETGRSATVERLTEEYLGPAETPERVADRAPAGASAPEPPGDRRPRVGSTTSDRDPTAGRGGSR